jgi:hypothetical protein
MNVRPAARCLKLGALASAGLLVGLLVASCGDASTDSSFVVTESDGSGALKLDAVWRYRSPKVDIDIMLTTIEDSETCSTTARLSVDKAVVGTVLHRIGPVGCSEVRLTDMGDLVLHGQTTGHDWSIEPLDVDTDRELIRLGPWLDVASNTDYRFTLASPKCKARPSCECPRLDRDANGDRISLEFGSDCN